MINNKKLNPIVTELLIRDRKLNILHNHILKYRKKLESIIHTFLL